MAVTYPWLWQRRTLGYGSGVALGTALVVRVPNGPSPQSCTCGTVPHREQTPSQLRAPLCVRPHLNTTAGTWARVTAPCAPARWTLVHMADFKCITAMADQGMQPRAATKRYIVATNRHSLPHSLLLLNSHAPPCTHRAANCGLPRRPTSSRSASIRRPAKLRQWAHAPALVPKQTHRATPAPELWTHIRLQPFWPELLLDLGRLRRSCAARRTQSTSGLRSSRLRENTLPAPVRA
jgi:hypothetical protein